MQASRVFGLLSLLILLGQQGYAQGIKYGARAGINISSVNVDYQMDIDTIATPTETAKVMYHAGALMRLSLTPKLGLQTGLTYSVRKNKSQLVDNLDGNEALTQYEGILPDGVYLAPGQADFNVDICTTHTMQFIEIPIVVNYQPVKFVNIQLGGQFSIAVENRMDVDANYSYSYPVLGFPVTVEQDIKLGLSGFDVDGVVTGHDGDDYQHRDLGLIAGISFELPFGPFLGVTYYRGLSPIETKDKQGPLPQGWATKTYYQNVQISLGYFFGGLSLAD